MISFAWSNFDFIGENFIKYMVKKKDYKDNINEHISG